MAVHLQKELESLRKELLLLGGMVEEALSLSIQALKTNDLILASKIKKRDQDIDEKEVEVEEACLKILALHQPVAVDLRFVIATLKINNDLERVGDLAVNIAKRVKYLAKNPPIPAPFDFEEMSSRTISMLKKALDSLVKLDAKMAEEVCLEDDVVDQMNKDMYKTVYEGIRKAPESVESYVQYLSVSRHLERIADYATNIAEDVIYTIEGTIVRHTPEDDQALHR